MRNGPDKTKQWGGGVDECVAASGMDKRENAQESNNCIPTNAQLNC